VIWTVRAALSAAFVLLLDAVFSEPFWASNSLIALAFLLLLPVLGEAVASALAKRERLSDRMAEAFRRLGIVDRASEAEIRGAYERLAAHARPGTPAGDELIASLRQARNLARWARRGHLTRQAWPRLRWLSLVGVIAVALVALFRLTFVQSATPFVPAAVSFSSSGLTPIQTQRLGLMVNVEGTTPDPLILGGECPRSADVTVNVDWSQLSKRERARLMDTPFTINVMAASVTQALATPARNLNGVTSLVITRPSFGVYRIEGKRLSDYTWASGPSPGAGITFSASWVSRRSFGSCWVQLPALRGQLVATMLPSKQVATPDRGSVQLLDFDLLDQSDTLPLPSSEPYPKYSFTGSG
jgi:hypothetical protein